MKIYLAGDHAGFRLKHTLAEELSCDGHEVVDLGPHELDIDDDYPDFVNPLAERLSKDPGAFGIILAGSGQGEAMAANRVRGVRCAIFYGKRSATDTLSIEGGRSRDGFDPIRLARLHNNANALSIGARFVPDSDAAEAVRIFLETPFDEETPRHSRRLAKF